MLRSNLGYVSDKKAPILNEFRNEYKSYMESKNLSSVKRNLTCYNNFTSFNNLGNKSFSDITKSDIVEFKSHRLKNNIKESTIDRDLAVIRAAFNICKSLYGFRGNNPINGSDDLFNIDNKKERILSKSEQNILLSNSPPHLYNIIIFALNTGCRKSEITSLKWKNIYLAEKYPYAVIEAENSKTKKSRKIPLNNTLVELLSKLNSTKKNSCVFNNSRGNPYHAGNGIDKAWRTARSRSNLNDFRFHDLRHSTATRLVNNNVPLMQVMKILGHENVSTTQRYSHVQNELKKAVMTLD